MCLSAEELEKASNEQLLDFYKRAIELKDGKSPFDIRQLRTAILERMGSTPVLVNVSKQEVGDGHDEFG